MKKFSFAVPSAILNRVYKENSLNSSILPLIVSDSNRVFCELLNLGVSALNKLSNAFLCQLTYYLRMSVKEKERFIAERLR